MPHSIDYLRGAEDREIRESANEGRDARAWPFPGGSRIRKNQQLIISALVFHDRSMRLTHAQSLD